MVPGSGLGGFGWAHLLDQGSDKLGLWAKGQSQRIGKKTIISFNYICDQSEVILDDYYNQINHKAMLKKIIVIYG